MSRILVRQGSGGWNEPGPAGYTRERDLQEILAMHPELIPGVSDSAVACREFQSDVGPADVVVVDADGKITLVECKLAANPQIRREIVGQLFDYAARLWRMDVDTFSRKWADRTKRQLFAASDSGEALKTEVADNLKEGTFRLVLAVDEINEPLKRMVEYLNARSTTGVSVVAVSYARYQYGDIEILTPQLYGEELAESKEAAVGQVRWNEDVYREWLARNRPEFVGAFDALIADVRALGWAVVGSLAVVPTAAIPIRTPDGRVVATIWIFYYTRQGVSLEFRFGPMAEWSEAQRPTRDALNDFLNDLGSIPALREVSARLRSSDFKSRGPNVSLSDLGEAELRHAFRIFAELVKPDEHIFRA